MLSSPSCVMKTTQRRSVLPNMVGVGRSNDALLPFLVIPTLTRCLLARLAGVSVPECGIHRRRRRCRAAAKCGPLALRCANMIVGVCRHCLVRCKQGTYIRVGGGTKMASTDALPALPALPPTASRPISSQLSSPP